MRWLGVLCLVAGCAGGPPVEVRTLQIAGAEQFAPVPGPEWRTVLPAAEPLWQAGDALRYGLRLEAAGQVTQWGVELTLRSAPEPEGPVHTLRVTLNGEPAEVRSRLVWIDVEVFDSRGEPIGKSSTAAGDRILAAGPAALCELVLGFAGRPRPYRLDAGDRTRFATAAYGTLLLFDTLQECEPLSPILWAVVQAPSPLSVLFSGGVSLNLHTDTDAARQTEAEVCGSGPTWELPFRIEANGSPAVVGKLLCATPDRPLQLAAGIVAIEASHPTDPSRRFSARLLGLR